MPQLKFNGFIRSPSFADGHTSLAILQTQSNYSRADPNLVFLTASLSMILESLPSLRFGPGVNPEHKSFPGVHSWIGKVRAAP